MSHVDDDDRLYDPMAYDVMREMANLVIGRYVVWEREAETPSEAAHWQEEWLRTYEEVRAVNPDSRSAVEAKTAELTATYRSMPEHAPAMTDW